MMFLHWLEPDDAPLSNRSANRANTEFTPEWLPALPFPTHLQYCVHVENDAVFY